MSDPIRLFIFGLGYTATAIARAMQGRAASVAGTVRSEAKAAELAGEGLNAMAFDGASPSARGGQGAAGRHPCPCLDPTRRGGRSRSSPITVPISSPRPISPGSAISPRSASMAVTAAPGSPSAPRRIPSADAPPCGLRPSAPGRDWGRSVGCRSAYSASPESTGPGAMPSSGSLPAMRIASSSPDRCSTAFTATTSSAPSRRRSLPRPQASTTSPTTSRRRRRRSSRYAAGLMGVPAPPEVPFEEADLSPMTRSFYDDNKRVLNRRLKEELGVSCAIRPIARVSRRSGATVPGGGTADRSSEVPDNQGS